MRIKALFVLLTIILSAACGQRLLDPISSSMIAAARAGNSSELARLVRNGADPNAWDNDNGWTPLLHAIHKNQAVGVRALLALGADPNRLSRDGKSTPLVMAASYGQAPIVRLLVAGGADPRKVTRNGVSPLAAAVTGTPDIDAFTFGSCQGETVQSILEAAPDAVKVTPVDRTSLLVARLGGCDRVVEMVKSGA